MDFYNLIFQKSSTDQQGVKCRQHCKYRHLAHDFHFIPLATETLGTFGPEAINFLEDLGHKLGMINGT